MKKFHAFLLFAAAAFAVAVPSAAFAVDADACGVQVSDAFEQKAVDCANSADLFEEGAFPAVSTAALSQEPVDALQPELSGESAAGEATQGGSGEQGEQPLYVEGWNAVGSDWYFVRNGALVSGWEYINGHWYWFDSSSGCKMATGWIELSGSRYYLEQGGDFQGAMSTGWILDGGSWYYADASGAVLNGWQYIGGAWYWFDSDNGCAMAQGCVTLGGQDYLLGEYGLVDGWALYDGAWYYGCDGKPEIGWLKLGGAWYWLDPSAHGAMATGWSNISSARYYFDASGAMSTGWILDGDSWYYADASGAVLNGWQYMGGAWYWLDASNDGKMATGFKQIGSSTYYFDASGAMSTGWVRDGSDWYYADASGAFHFGWLSAYGGLYYLDPACGFKLATGYFSVDGLNYFANDSGEIAVRQWLTVEDGTTVFAGVDGAFCGKLDNGVLYVPNADGVLEPASGFVKLGGCMFYVDPETHAPSSGWKQFDGAWYYFDENGCAHTGWLDDNGPWYYLGDSGVLQTGWIDVDGSWYYANDSGRMETGWLYDGGSWYYFSESSCAMQTGWIYVNGTWYYANASGRMETGWLSSGGAWYWFDGNGAMATGWRWINGSWYFFRSNGVWISDSMNAKAQSYSSRTNWLILVDTSRCITSIYYGSQGNWDLNRRYVCSTGRAGTPTVIGEYEVYGKGYSFGLGYTCYYYTQFYGDYLFHSSPYYVNSNRIMDPTMGVPSSAGCVRLEIQNAKWIYDNIPYGTKVVTYN